MSVGRFFFPPLQHQFQLKDRSMANQNNDTRAKRIVAEIISVGDEITTGSILDTNAPYLSQSLAEIGVRTLYQTTISDDMDAMVAAFAIAFRRADVVVCTGGLGPTQDDLTRQAAANVMGVELEFDQPSFEHTSQLFARRGRTMPESNKIQAYFPKGSRVIFNPNGTAPGFIIETSRANLPDANVPYAALTSGSKLTGDFILLTFPGVPAELYEMWKGPDGRAAVERFVDRIQGGERTVYRTKRIHSFGAGESAIEARLPGLIDRDHFPTVGITAKNSVITLRIFAEGRSEEECDSQIDEISRDIYKKVGEFVFGEDDESFSNVLCHNLRAQCRKVGVFEWGTQGLLTKTIESDVLGFGRVFGEEHNAEFAKLFGDSSATPDELKKKRDKKEIFSSTFYVENVPITSELEELFNQERSDDKVDYLLAVGPYPTELSNANTGAAGLVDVAFVDFRDSQKPVMRRETFAFGGQPAMIDTLFCNRALDLLLRNQ